MRAAWVRTLEMARNREGFFFLLFNRDVGWKNLPHLLRVILISFAWRHCDRLTQYRRGWMERSILLP